jgi:hypothetical protein
MITECLIVKSPKISVWLKMQFLEIVLNIISCLLTFYYNGLNVYIIAK